MKKVAIGAVALIIIVSGFSLIGASESTSTAVVTPLNGQDFISTYRETDGAVLLDVRTPGEFTGGHVQGAINVDFNSPSFSGEMQKLDKTKPYFVYCRSGNRSGQAVLLMRKAGIQNIVELKGGIVSNQDTIELVTDSPQ
jgi:rhodanese-related sulfurtransferase